MVAGLEPDLQPLLKHVLNFSELSSAKGKFDFDAMVSFRTTSLHVSTALSPVSSNVLDIYRRSHHLDIVQGELGALGDDVTVDRNHGTPVVVESISVTPLLVRIQVNTPELRRFEHQAMEWTEGDPTF